jgi:hypothetical protein
MPSTPTNKILKRTLVHQKFRADRTGGDPMFVRLRGDDVFRPFGPGDEQALRERFAATGRERFLDL